MSAYAYTASTIYTAAHTTAVAKWRPSPTLKATRGPRHTDRHPHRHAHITHSFVLGGSVRRRGTLALLSKIACHRCTHRDERRHHKLFLSWFSSNSQTVFRQNMDGPTLARTPLRGGGGRVGGGEMKQKGGDVSPLPRAPPRSPLPRLHPAVTPRTFHTTPTSPTRDEFQNSVDLVQ